MSKLQGQKVEEKGSLLKKIKALEVSNQKMQDEIMNLHKDNHQSNQTEPHTITRALHQQVNKVQKKMNPKIQ